MMARTSTTKADLSDQLDAQLAELIQTVWTCERTARAEDRIDALVLAATRYGRP